MIVRPPGRPNFYATGGIERAAHLRADAAWLAARLADPATRVVPVWRARNLVAHLGSDGAEPRAATLSVAEVRDLFGADAPFALLGLVAEVAHFALDVSHLDASDGAGPFAEPGRFVDLRAIGPLLPRDEGALLAYARGLMHWHGRHRFCGLCGAPTEIVAAGHQRRCTDPDCRADHFPRIDPAVIMLVHDGGERIVLGRQRVWPAGMHSVLAGFVEPGESLEDALAREVMEEIGVAVGDIRYHSSQPWPFPASIMLGFTARAGSARLRVNRAELEDGRWYSRAELLASPEDQRFRLPRRDSIARRLVDDWLAGHV
jgi:NAD+ diphosphatase